MVSLIFPAQPEAIPRHDFDGDFFCRRMFTGLPDVSPVADSGEMFLDLTSPVFVAMDGEEGTTKYAKGAKREAKLQSSTLAYFAHFVVKSDFR